MVATHSSGPKVSLQKYQKIDLNIDSKKHRSLFYVDFI